MIKGDMMGYNWIIMVLMGYDMINDPRGLPKNGL
jgi:hypothetical protein